MLAALDAAISERMRCSAVRAKNAEPFMAEAEQEKPRCPECGNHLRKLHELVDTHTGKVVRVFKCTKCDKLRWED